MSTGIQAAPDLKVKYVRRVKEDRRERENAKVETLEEREQCDDAGSQTYESHRGRMIPAVRRSCVRVFTVFLVVLYLLTLAAIIIRYVSVTLEKDQLSIMNEELQTRYNKLRNLYNQSQSHTKLLQDKLFDIAVNYSYLHDEVKKLKAQHEHDQGKLCPEGWTRFGCSCYFKSSENQTWSESRRDCESRGSDLVIISSKEEQDFVSEMNMNRESWIGLISTTRGTTIRFTWRWEWVDGSPLGETFWAPGHWENPLHFRCVTLDHSGKWRMRREHDSEKYWICEKNITCFC